MNGDKLNSEYQKEIEVVRDQIDELDTKLVALLESRMNISSTVAEIKQKYGMEIFDKNREDIILEKISSKVENANLAFIIKNIYKEIFANSRFLQRDKINAENISKEKCNFKN